MSDSNEIHAAKDWSQDLKNLAPETFEKIPPHLRPEVQKLVSRLVAVKRTNVTHYSGPLPPPEQMERYNTILPGTAERILAMAESQSRHRQIIEERVISAQIKESSWGQKFAFILAVLCITGGLFVTVDGYPTVGMVLLGTTVLGLAATFVYGKRSQAQTLARRDTGE